MVIFDADGEHYTEAFGHDNNVLRAIRVALNGRGARGSCGPQCTSRPNGLCWDVLPLLTICPGARVRSNCDQATSAGCGHAQLRRAHVPASRTHPWLPWDAWAGVCWLWGFRRNESYWVGRNSFSTWLRSPPKISTVHVDAPGLIASGVRARWLPQWAVLGCSPIAYHLPRCLGKEQLCRMVPLVSFA